MAERKPSALDVRVGCAGWSIPKAFAEEFSTAGTHLQRYAERFSAVEINSSFYKPHQAKTYVKWADAVRADFQFAVKAPKEITHARRLREANDVLDRFLTEVAGLGDRLGPILVQLPPSLEFDGATAGDFFTALRERFNGLVACEPRHPTWFEAEADSLLVGFQVARVAADPAFSPIAAEPGGWTSLTYYRLHGSPRMYYSNYSAEQIGALADRLRRRAAAGPTWCIFDNTALSAATGNALETIDRLGDAAGPTRG